MNKKLLIITILLTIIYIISFSKKETNFIMPKNNVIDSMLQTVNINYNNKHIKLSIEDYLIGVVAAEMPASFEEEALKAQTIAAHTYLINTMSTTPIDTTTNAQVYIDTLAMQAKWGDDYTKYYNKIANCVKETKDYIITYNNEPIKAFYYSMSNGYTSSSIDVFNEQYNYLNTVESIWDSNNSKTIAISKEEFCKKLNIECNTINITNIKKDDSNRVNTITINNKTYKGTEIRKLLSLRSTDFIITEKDTLIEITTKGYGHGVGMSQYGANEMAKLGYNYKQILKYYYQNTEITNI